MSKDKEKTKAKEKTAIFSTKIFIGISIVGFLTFMVIFAYGTSAFRSIFSFPENNSNLQVVSSGVSSSDPLITLASLKPSLKDTDPVRGPSDASVTIIEFGDFKCPYCASMHDTLKEVLEYYPQEVRLVWKDLPISSIEGQAYDAAIVARCAQLQEKFWGMHDRLLDNSSSLTLNNYSEFAQELELNLDDFNQCVDLKKTASLVDGGIKEALALSIDGTPHFYINKQEISGTATFEDIKQLVEIELER